MPDLNFSLPIRQAKLTAAEGMLNDILKVQEKKSSYCPFQANNNLDVAITQVATQCHTDMRNATLGCGHYLTKFAHGTAVLVGATAIPVVLSGIGLKHLVNNVVLSSSENLLLSGGVIASAWCVNKAMDKVFGFKPLNFLALTAVATVNSLANTASEIAIIPYTRREERVESFKHDRQLTKIAAQKEAYYGIAHHLALKYQEAQNDPQAMYELKTFARKLESKLPLIKEAFESVNISPSESSQILDEVITVLGLIDTYRLEVRNSHSSEDQRYNTQLMCILPPAGIPENCISQEVVAKIKDARDYKLGIAHTCKEYLHTAAMTALTALSIPTVTALVTNYAVPTAFESLKAVCLEGDVDTSVAGIAAASAAILGSAAVVGGALYAGAKIAKNITQSYTEEREQHTNFVQNNIAAANTDIKTIYDGIADHLLEQHKLAGNDSKAFDKVRIDALSIRAKLPLVETELAKYPEIQNPADILSKLDSALSEILLSEQFQWKSPKVDFSTFAAA